MWFNHTISQGNKTKKGCGGYEKRVTNIGVGLHDKGVLGTVYQLWHRVEL